jgi:hypothetical protein
MTEAPKRSTRDTIGQLLVIAILIGILIGAVILLRQFIDSHNTSDAARPGGGVMALSLPDHGRMLLYDLARTGDSAIVSFTNSSTAYAAAS